MTGPGMAPKRKDRELKGVFITFEGCEGCGKTTQAELLKEYLLSKGKDVVLVREPGGTLVGEKIREILLDPAHDRLAPVTEALLFAADRAQQLKEVIVPSLEKGWVVVGDRYVDSSLAYQGVGRGCGLEGVKNLNEWATGGIQPDLTLFLDLPVETGLKRASGEECDRIEMESVEFHKNVRHAYDMLLRLFSHRMVLVDAKGPPQAVHSRVVQEAGRVLG